MAYALLYAIVSALIISLLSLAGIFFLALSDKRLKKILLHLVGFSAGALIGGAFLHLMPETLSKSESLPAFSYLILGVIIFYIMERFLKWHHCHENGHCDVHTFTYMSLVGDAIHNFIDGIVIVSAFSSNVMLGIVTSVIIIGHELPQEIGDFGVLVYGGFSKKKALLFNFLTAITAVLGVLAGFILGQSIEGFNTILLPFAAGGFLYIAMSDLIPELHKEENITKSFTQFLLFVAGVGLMLLIKILFGS